jgi:FMN phosphatase YigB (HAD superfamily)
LLNRSLANLVECGDAFDWVVWDWDDTLVRKDGKPDPDAIACLHDLKNRGIRQVLLSKNPAVRDLMRVHQIPDFFETIRQAEDKIAAAAALLDECRIDPGRCIMINDAYSEILALQDVYPDLRIVTPDALELLGRERVS